MRACTFTLLLGLGCGLVALPARGDDCANDIPPSNPSTAYVDHGDGTTTDQRSGLMWKRCSEGQSWTEARCQGEPSQHTWQQSLSIAQASRFAGHGDWRVPNVRELRTIIELCRVGPAINQSVFPDTAPSEFWTASPSTGTKGAAWYIEFHQGMSFSRGGKLSPYRLRLVRTPAVDDADKPASATQDPAAPDAEASRPVQGDSTSAAVNDKQA